MFDTSCHELYPGAYHYVVRRPDATLSYGEALNLLCSDERFRAFMTQVLAASPLEAFRWETPAISNALLGRDFEFVLLDAPELMAPTDARTFAGYFDDDDSEAGVVTFQNLGGDALLLVPTPRGVLSHYAHLAAFLRGAPCAQQHALWLELGRAIAANLGDQSLWVSTHGGGVAWVHVRLDARPKYYGHLPYRAED